MTLCALILSVQQLTFVVKCVAQFHIPLVPKIAGSLLAEAVGFFRQKNPQHAFLQKGNKAICPISQICGMLKNPISYHGSHKL
jgi:hypothetical protein